MVMAPGQIRLPGDVSQSTWINDISINGCRATEWLKRPGVRLWVKIAHLAPLEGMVRHGSHASCGIEFTNPLHPSVLAHIVDQYRVAVRDAD